MPNLHDGDTVTIAVVARRAGVSTATVSRVLRGSAATSESARKNVLVAARELDYRPRVRVKAREPDRRRVHGLVLRDLLSYHSELLLGHESAAADLGESVLLSVTERHADASDAVRELAARVDGLVLACGTVPDQVVQSVARSIPVVLLGRAPLPGCDSVMAENVESARLLTAHVIDHGRTHLVFVGDPDSAPEVADRYRGFRLAHAAAAIPVRRPPLRVPLLEGAGRKVADEVLRRRVRVDGLVCGNDDVALGVLQGLREQRVLVPDDLAIVGWDDVTTARHVSPGLTTVSHPARQLGRAAGIRLQERIAGAPPEAAAHVLETDVVIRESCGCPALVPSGRA